MVWPTTGTQMRFLQDVALCASVAVKMVVSFLRPSSPSRPRNMHKRLAASTSTVSGGRRRMVATSQVSILFNSWSRLSLFASLSKRRTAFVATLKASDLRQCPRQRPSAKSSSRSSWASPAPSHATLRRTSRSSLGEFLQALSRRLSANTLQATPQLLALCLLQARSHHLDIS